MNHFGDKILLRRAHDYIERYHPLLIGVAGRLNQSLVKTAIGLSLKKSHVVHTMPRVFTSPRSVALSILGVGESHKLKNWWKLLIGSRVREFIEDEPDMHVVEIDPHLPGDIDLLTQTFPFFIGVVTGIPTRALETFVDKQTVAHEIESLLVQLPRQGYAILNSDDPLVANMASKTVAQVITYGSHRTADIRLTRVQKMQQGIGLEFTTNEGHHELYLSHLVSVDQAMSILPAIAVAKAFKQNIDDILPQLAQLVPPVGQLKKLIGVKGTVLLDASYDATPEDMLAALEALDNFPSTRKIAILSFFNDLGHQTKYWNEELGKKAGSIAPLTLIVGTDIPEARKAALSAGSDVHHFKNSLDVGKWLETYLKPGDVILINGTKQAKLEEVVFRLLPQDERPHTALARKVRFA